MAVNNPHGYNQYTKKKKAENADFSAEGGGGDSSGGAAGARGGASEQHAEAGRPSRKSDGELSSSSGG